MTNRFNRKIKRSRPEIEVDGMGLVQLKGMSPADPEDEEDLTPELIARLVREQGMCLPDLQVFAEQGFRWSPKTGSLWLDVITAEGMFRLEKSALPE